MKTVEKFARRLAVTTVPAAPREVAGIANLKGRVVTLLSLGALLELEREAIPGQGPQLVNAVIFKPVAGAGQMGFVVDKPGDLIDAEDGRIIFPQPTGGEKAPPHIAGVYEDGGTIYRIIDIHSIIRHFTGDGYGAGPLLRGGTLR